RVPGDRAARRPGGQAVAQHGSRPWRTTFATGPIASARRGAAFSGNAGVNRTAPGGAWGAWTPS
ncbi:MAG: hypothetical protein ACRDI2_12675, partial [Chloroflexota bacterium]